MKQKYDELSMQNKFTIVGISGKMGQELLNLLQIKELIGGIHTKTNDDQMRDLIARSEAVIDFSRPLATIKTIQIAAECGVPYVSGTTGFTNDELNIIEKQSQKIPVMIEANFSLGIHFIAACLKKCGQIFSDFDFNIIERHHKHKKDSPSGTALFLSKQVTQSCGISSVRAGNICGDHICAFTGNNEEIIMGHRAFSRTIFAKGAIECAKWIINKKAGLYSISDLLIEKGIAF